jgi:uncharacterized protein with ParB-like and HNH nuclease domain/predicted transport protein
MKAVESQLLSLLKKAAQFLIPIYQRTYSWEKEQCEQLWKDILRAGSSDSINAHFVGSIVYIQDDIYHLTNQSPLLVIDGQQRLTTVTLILAALMERLASLPDCEQEPEDGFSPQKIRNYYLINDLERGDRKYKLLLTQTDKDTLKSVVMQDDLPPQISLRICTNLGLFRGWISECDNLAIVCKGINKLMVVDVALSRGQDNPQLIFESMNSTGRELTQADLIRNYILMGLEHDKQTDLYNKYWYPMEQSFGQSEYNLHFDGFMRHFLTIMTGEIPKQSEVYVAFKKFHADAEYADIEGLVADLKRYSGYYCAMALGKEQDTKLRAAFHDLSELKVEVAYPMMLEIYNDYADQKITAHDLHTIVRMIESYVFRRAICGYATNSLNKTFATFMRGVNKENYLESIKINFLKMKSYRIFPRNDDFKRYLQERDIYKIPKRCRYFLNRVENHGRKEQVMLSNYSIEHIMPQNENLSPAWKNELGENWENIRSIYLHRIGNLTLTGYNTEYSDRPFSEKRDMEGGFRSSPLKLNEGLGQLDRWNEEAIINRARKLSCLATKIWAEPELSDEQKMLLDQGRVSSNQYSVEDHPALRKGKPQELYNIIRHEILNLDPEIYEEFLKYYVAYKAETNICDIAPHTSYLTIYVNMPFSEVETVESICRNVSDIGHSGNGEIELRFSDIKDLPYIMGLITRSFERQISNGIE